MSSAPLPVIAHVDQEVADVLIRERKKLSKKEEAVKSQERKVKRDETRPPKDMSLVSGRLHELTKLKAEAEGLRERAAALEKGDFDLFPELQSRKRKAPGSDGSESELTQPSDEENEPGEPEVGAMEREHGSRHGAKRRRATYASPEESERAGNLTVDGGVLPTPSTKLPEADGAPSEKSVTEDGRSSTVLSEARNVEGQSSSQATGDDVPKVEQGKSSCETKELVELEQTKAKEVSANTPAREGDESEKAGEGQSSAVEGAAEGKSEKKNQPTNKGKQKAIVRPNVEEEEEEGRETDVDESDEEKPYVYTAARQRKEDKAKLAVTRYLEMGGKEVLRHGLRAHVRERASHTRRVGTACYNLAKCLSAFIIVWWTRLRGNEISRGGELLGVPYAPLTVKELKTVEGVTVNGFKLPVTAAGEPYCHCGCRLEDAIWGFFLWKSGRIEYDGDGHGYEVARKPPTPAQRNFEITRLKRLGFELEDMWSHELVLGVYRELTPKDVFQRRVGHLLVRMKPALLLNGDLPEELDFTVAGGLFKMDESDEPKLEENDG
ncbi:hypothetical protein V5O48_015314 [Marasmius crinis-equi]|uniref:Uncharacterized protein n=1 Tax=Marasmius crinis-equi TaxID=585013 RepID=A0ABR3EUV2_9AGAR